jgi:hypothetical protein
MSEWPATKARRALAALQRIAWRIVRASGSHRTLRREGWPQYRFACTTRRSSVRSLYRRGQANGPAFGLARDANRMRARSTIHEQRKVRRQVRETQSGRRHDGSGGAPRG